MAKKVNSTTGKGILDIDWTAGKATITTITKDDELVFDFFKILNEYNGKQISFNLKEDIDLPQVGE